jgi:hypothetical protein
MTATPRSNPYWDEHYKPHSVDPDEIRSLCLRAFQIVMSSQGVASLYDHSDDSDDEDPKAAAPEDDAEEIEIPLLFALYRENSERMLSETLLKMAIFVRTLEDQVLGTEASERFKDFLAALNGEDGFGTVFDGPEGLVLTLRECCNKIIHAEDFRPVYDKDGASDVPGGWAMDGQLELEGRHGKKEWKVAIYLIDFLEAVLAFCNEVQAWAASVAAEKE